MHNPVQKTLWELLWDYDPNGLVAVDQALNITVVNPSFCRMFKTSPSDAIGRPAMDFMDDAAELAQLFGRSDVVSGREKRYEELDLFVRKVMFSIPDQDIVACIMVDLTTVWKQRQELLRIRTETIKHVREVVDNQVKIAQEIASLLGETTDDTKVGLIHLTEMLQRDVQ